MRKLADFLWSLGNWCKDRSTALHARAARRAAPPFSQPLTFERLCMWCAPYCKPGEWFPVTKGTCQRCENYRDLMAFKR